MCDCMTGLREEITRLYENNSEVTAVGRYIRGRLIPFNVVSQMQI